MRSPTSHPDRKYFPLIADSWPCAFVTSTILESCSVLHDRSTWTGYRGVTRLEGTLGKKQVWRPYGRNWGLSKANVQYCIEECICGIVVTFQCPGRCPSLVKPLTEPQHMDILYLIFLHRVETTITSTCSGTYTYEFPGQLEKAGMCWNQSLSLVHSRPVARF